MNREVCPPLSLLSPLSPPPSRTAGHDGDYVFLCGPPPMVNACKKNLEKMGYDEAHMLSF